VQQVEAMKAMVNAFSEYARAPDMKVTRFPLNALVDEVADLHRVQESAVQIDVEADSHIDQLEGRPWPGAPDPQQSHRQRGRGGGTRRARAGDGGDEARNRGRSRYATITVSDNGPGFTREVLGHAFDPYVTSKPKGTGLGLRL
jgi:nitrogen fixation/metabolism regulation signal transduction histidine kinase